MSVEEAFAALHGEKVEAVQTLYNSEDNKEGPIAFAENRPPVWKGC